MVMRLFWALAVALLASLACADGIYIPRERTQDPSIPYQRAILKFKDGQESLIVESFLQGRTGDYAWIVPVPNEPTLIEPVSAGTIETLGEIVKPKVGKLEFALIWIPCLFLALFSVFIATYPSRATQTKRSLERMVFSSLAWTLCTGVFILVFAIPAFTQAKAASSSPMTGVNVRDWGSLGDYRVQSVAGPAAASWLDAHGFALNATEKRALASYIRDKWHFIAIQVSKPDAPNSSPHPLKITFPSRGAVYPMRLTLAMGKPLELDLFVLGEGTADIPGARNWGSVAVKSSRNFGPDNLGVSDPTAVNWTPVNHPQIVPMLWNQAMLTRLHAIIPPTSLHRDFAVGFGHPSGQTATVTDRGDLLLYAIVVFFVWIAAVSTAGACFAVSNDLNRSSLSFSSFSTITIGAVSLGLVVLGSFEPVSSKKGARLTAARASKFTLSAVRGLTPQEVADDPLSAVRAQVSKLGIELVEKDVPSGITVERLPSMYRFRVYDLRGKPTEVDVPVAQKDGGR